MSKETFNEPMPPDQFHLKQSLGLEEAAGSRHRVLGGLTAAGYTEPVEGRESTISLAPRRALSAHIN